LYAGPVKEDRTIVPDSFPPTPHQPIRVLIVDSHAAVRSGLRLALLAFDDLELVGEATSGDAVLGLCAQARPDVVLMDRVRGTEAVDVTRAIHQRFPCIQVIALTSFSGEGGVPETLEAGAAGHLLKNVTAEELADAIRAAHAAQAEPAPATRSQE
jgi:NarL family two-component system response regulator LiaR